MDTELKPCPFCGEEAGICEANDIFFHRDDDGNKIFGGWRCFCPSCAIEQIGYETREEAVSAWNNRSTEHATHRAPVDEKGGGRMTGIERLRALAYKKNFLEPAEARELDAIADQIEREYDAGVADSPYDDLLPQEDRDAIAWVREHGGLDSVKRLLDWVVGHCSTRQQLDFDFWLSGRVMHELGFEEDMADRDEVERRLLARLMPEGYEWPRYESGEPLRYEDRYVYDGREREVWHVDFDSYGEPTILNKDGTRSHTDKGERVKRPAPKVLDADGVEIRVGDVLYYVDGREQRVNTVARLTDDGYVQFGRINEAGYVTYCEAACIQPNQLTHRAPVLAADGRPLREGETVWDTNGDELVIGAIEDGGHTVNCRYADVGDAIPVHGMWSPSDLTHERPDSWERIEEDAGCTATKYNERRGTIFTTKQQVARDLVRRCRALAERERGE